MKRSHLTPDQHAALAAWVQGCAPLDTPDAATEAALLARATTGDDVAREELLRRNVRLAALCASRFAGNGVDMADLCQVAWIGINKAIDKWDSAKGRRFSTYATRWALAESRRLGEQYHRNRISITAGKHYARIQATVDTFTATHGRQPTADELPDVAGVSQGEWDTLRHTAQVSTLSLDTTYVNRLDDSHVSRYGQERGTWHDVTPDPAADDAFAAVEYASSNDVAMYLDCLSATERHIVDLCFGLNGGAALSDREIEEQTGLTNIRARRFRAIEKMRRVAQGRGDMHTEEAA